MRYLRRVRFILTGVVPLLLALGLSSAGASSANISHSYHTDSDIADGSLVSLDAKRTDYVVVANTDNGERLIGVAVQRDDSLLAVDPSATAVQIATSGNANALVSTVNGDIDVGDQIAVSPFNGVGMKADPGSRIIGLAQTKFSADSDGATTRKVQTKDGKTNSIQIGYIRVAIGVGTATSSGGTSEASLSGLQRWAKSLTGHVISTPRIIIALIVAVVAAVALVTLIYASIYGSIISVGRNPLARNAIFRTLGSVIGMALVTGLVATVTIFLLLH